MEYTRSHRGFFKWEEIVQNGNTKDGMTWAGMKMGDGEMRVTTEVGEPK